MDIFNSDVVGVEPNIVEFCVLKTMKIMMKMTSWSNDSRMILYQLLTFVVYLIWYHHYYYLNDSILISSLPRYNTACAIDCYSFLIDCFMLHLVQMISIKLDGLKSIERYSWRLSEDCCCPGHNKSKTTSWWYCHQPSVIE